MPSIFERVRYHSDKPQPTQTAKTQAGIKRYQKPLIVTSLAGAIAWAWFNVELPTLNNAQQQIKQTQLHLPVLDAEASTSPIIKATPTVAPEHSLPSTTNHDTLTHNERQITAPNNHINEQVIELIQAGKTTEATKLLEDKLTENPEAGILFENLRSLYAGFASQSYQAALNPSKMDSDLVRITLLADNGVAQEVVLPSLKDQAEANAQANNIAKNTVQQPTAATKRPEDTDKAVQHQKTSQPSQPAPALVAAETLALAPVEPDLPPIAPATATNNTSTNHTNIKPNTTETTEPAKPAVSPPKPIAEIAQAQMSEPKPAITMPSVTAQPDLKAIEKAVLQATQRWASAWSKQDISGYFASYSPNFIPQKTNKQTWQTQRKTRIQAPSFIKVELSNLQIQQLSSNTAKLRFTQNYQSNTFNSVDQRTIELEFINQQWLITAESGR